MRRFYAKLATVYVPSIQRLFADYNFCSLATQLQIPGFDRDREILVRKY